MRNYFFSGSNIRNPKTLLWLLLSLKISLLTAQSNFHCDYEILPETSSITSLTFRPGDTLCLMAGARGPLYLKNIIGTEREPIVVINKGGQSIISSDLTYGLRFAESKHIILSGSGDSNTEYGILIQDVVNGYGLDIGTRSTNFEIEYLEIKNVKIAGIVAKTDPNCIFPSDRENFTMFNLKIHNNYIHHTGNEGMYIGSSFFLGQYISSCNATLFPHIIDGVEIYNNRVEYTGWDGIQVGSALNNCNVHNNLIYKDSQAEATYQMSGIIINTGSRCNVFNNQIIDGKGTGILNQGAGGQKFYNNLIVNAGRDYDFEDQILKQQFGIFSKYTYIEPPDSTFHFYNNTIVNPKSDGIRIMNQHGEIHRVINNIIVNPGAYDFYANLGSVNYQASDAYVHNYLDGSAVLLTNNIFDRSSKNQFFADTTAQNYHLTNNSPAVNAGSNLSNYGVYFDIENYNRPFETYFDIGAYEYQLITSTHQIENTPNSSFLLSPNPATNSILIRFNLLADQKLSLKLVSIDGKTFDIFQNIFFPKGENSTTIPIENLPAAEYIVVLYNEGILLTQLFLKQD